MPRPPVIARLRILLLLFLVVLIAGLIGLYLFGRAGRQPPASGGGSDDGEPFSGELAAVGEGFQFTAEDEGERVFSMQGVSYRLDVSGKVEIDEMELTLYPPDGGDPYRVQSARALLDEEQLAAELSDGVQVDSTFGLRMATPQMELRRRGKLLVSRETVEFDYEGTAKGRGDQLQANLEEGFFVLVGDVALDSLPGTEMPFALRTTRLYYHRGRSQLRADGELSLTYGPHSLSARRLSIFLSEDQKPQFARALWQVSGTIGVPASAGAVAAEGGAAEGGAAEGGAAEGGAAPIAPARPVRFSAQSLSALFEPEGNEIRKFELEGSAVEPAVLTSVDASGLTQRLTAGYLVGDFRDGRVVSAEAFGGIEVVELAAQPEGGAPDQPPLRRIVAERAQAAFGPGATLIELELEDAVEYRGDGLVAQGDRALLDMAAETGELFGAPLTMVGAFGEATAPHAVWADPTRVLQADGGVRVRLEKVPESAGGDAAQSGGSTSAVLAGGPLARGEGPIWVESAEALMQEEPRAYLFKGAVRAWRGDDLLLADEIQIDEFDSRLAARGNVRTLLDPGRPDAGSGGAGAPEDALAGPLEVTAGELDYRRNENLLIYRRQVRAVQGSRRLECEELTVELAAAARPDAEVEAGEPEVLVCSGDVVITDPPAGRTIRGDWARYEVSGRLVEVRGQAVAVEDAAGGTVSGRRLLYDFTTGVVQMQSEEGSGRDAGTSGGTGAGSGEGAGEGTGEGTGEEDGGGRR